MKSRRRPDNEARFFLRTARLGFRLWTGDDLDLAVGLWGDPQVTRLIDPRGKLAREEIRKRLADEIAVEREYGVQYWPIFLLANGEHVGCCGLRPHDPSQRIYELGVHIRSTHWRHGFAIESCSAVIEYALDALKAGGLFAGHNPDNHASRRLLDKLGFKYARDEFYPPTGLWHPSYLLTPPAVF